MCRFFIIKNKETISNKTIRDLLWFSSHSLFKQCYVDTYTPQKPCKTNDHLINLDGFGIGWYMDDIAYTYRNTIPSWNDQNFLQLTNLIRTKTLLGHIRAIKPIYKNSFHDINNKETSSVNIHNCHPFRYKEWLFCHNGYIKSFNNGKLRKKLIMGISDEYITKLEGTCDSEYVFYLFLTYKLKLNIKDAIIETIKFLVSLNPKLANYLNFCVTNSEEIVVTRYTNLDTKPPSLYLKQTKDDIIISSEPLVKDCDEWNLIEKNSLIYIKKYKFKTFSINI